MRELKIKTISKHKFNRILKRPDSKQYYKIRLGTHVGHPDPREFDNPIKYLEYKKFYQTLSINLIVVLGDYYYCNIDGEYYRRDFEDFMKKSWYSLEDLSDLYLEENLKVSVGNCPFTF